MIGFQGSRSIYDDRIVFDSVSNNGRRVVNRAMNNTSELKNRISKTIED